MLVELTAPIDLGFLIDATLVFEKAGALPMTFEVEPAGTKLEDTEGHHE
jgi:copper(I)-binding protein